MTDLFTFSLSVFTGFFAIMNPLANTPIFVSLTSDKSEASKKRIAKTACITAFLIVTAFILLGKYIFEAFGITVPAFKITGGILVFYVGFEMLQSKPSKIQHQDDVDTDDTVAISPLATPILAGPGTIITAMNYITSGNYISIAIVVGIFALMILLTYLAFSLSDRIIEKLGHNIILVVGKIMGLILGIMGIGMLIEGIKLAFDL